MDMAALAIRDASFQARARDWFHSGESCVLVRTLKRQQRIYQEGERADHIACIANGSVQISTFAHGHRCPVALRFRGDLIGELSACGMRVRKESAVALEHTTILVAPVAGFLAFVQQERLMALMVGYFAEALLQQQHRIAQLLLEKCERRLALTLLELAERHGGGDVIPLHLTQADLGQLIGTTRSRIGHFLKHFRELGLLGHYDVDGIQVDRKRLADYCR